MSSARNALVADRGHLRQQQHRRGLDAAADLGAERPQPDRGERGWRRAGTGSVRASSSSRSVAQTCQPIRLRTGWKPGPQADAEQPARSRGSAAPAAANASHRGQRHGRAAPRRAASPSVALVVHRDARRRPDRPRRRAAGSAPSTPAVSPKTGTHSRCARRPPAGPAVPCATPSRCAGRAAPALPGRHRAGHGRPRRDLGVLPDPRAGQQGAARPDGGAGADPDPAQVQHVAVEPVAARGRPRSRPSSPGRG